MSQERSREKSETPETLALSTKLEEDFVSPLTAVRGALEILRDFPDMADAERRDFVDRALAECARMRKGVDELAASVYTASRREGLLAGIEPSPAAPRSHADRLTLHADGGIAELDLSDCEFSAPGVVDDFFDGVRSLLEAQGGTWFFLVNHRNCSVWPEAWVAFAHRSKRLSDAFSRGTVRYADGDGDSARLPARDEALRQIEAMRTDGD